MEGTASVKAPLKAAYMAPAASVNRQGACERQQKLQSYSKQPWLAARQLQRNRLFATYLSQQRNRLDHVTAYHWCITLDYVTAYVM